MNVGHEGRAIEVSWPVGVANNRQTGMSMAASGNGVHPGTAAGAGPVSAAPVQVIGDSWHQLVCGRVWVIAEHSLVTAPGNHMPNVGNDAVGDERLASFIEIQSPRIGASVGHQFKTARNGVVTPDTAIHFDAFVFG